MAVIIDQPLTDDYSDPLSTYIMSMGFEDDLPGVRRMDLLFHEAGIDHHGLCYWRLRMVDFETGRTMGSAYLNGEGQCTIDRIDMSGQSRPIAKIQLGLETIYSYEYPFAYVRRVDQTSPLAEFNRKAWGIWMHAIDGREVASYVMSTSEQCRLCCVGTVTGHDYEMGFDCEGGHVADVKNDLLADRVYSPDAYNYNGVQVERALAKVTFHPDSTLYGRTLCMITLIALACYNLVTFFNPKSAPPKKRKRRR